MFVCKTLIYIYNSIVYRGLFSIHKNGFDFRLLHSPFLVASGLVLYRSSWYVKGQSNYYILYLLTSNDALSHEL